MRVADVKVFLGLLLNAYKPAPGLENLRAVAGLVSVLEEIEDPGDSGAPSLHPALKVLMHGILLEMIEAPSQGRAALSPAQSIPLLRLLDELTEVKLAALP